MQDKKVQLIVEMVDNLDREIGKLKRELSGVERHHSGVIQGMKKNWLELTSVLGSVYLSYNKILKPTAEYLATIETAQLGIASAFMTSGKYIDETTGKALEGSAALKAAQADSADVIRDLQAANLQTIATLDQLVRAYQDTLPVAMRVGFNKQQIQDFTVATVQAAGAIGLSLDMLAEETRSMLIGVITPRTSRIAVVLGLTNDDIRRNSGNADQLFNFLMDKLSAYRLAGIETQKTWNGLWSNVKDLSQQASGMALQPLFELVKKELYDITNDIVTIDETTKQIKWDPDFLATIESARSAINSLVIGTYELGMALDSVGGLLIRVMGTLTALGAALTWGDWDKAFRNLNKQLEDFHKDLEANYKRSQKAVIDLKVNKAVGSGAGGARFNQNAPGPNAEEMEKAAKASAKLAKEYETLKVSLEREIAKAALDDLDKKLFDASTEFEDLRAKLGSDRAENIWKLRIELIKEEELQKSIDAMGKAFKSLEEQYIPSEADRQKITDFWASVEDEITQTTGTEIDKRLLDNKRTFDAMREEAREALVYHEEIEKALTQINALEEKARADIRAQYASERREAELNNQLALLDVAEKQHALSKPDLVAERLRLTEELLAVELQRLEDANPEKDLDPWISINNEIAATRQRILDLTEAQRELTGTFTEGMAEGLTRYAEDAQTTFQGALEVVKTVTSGMESAFSQFFDYASEDFINFGKLAEDILNDIYKELMKVLAIQPLVQGISSGFQGLIGGSGMTAEMTGWDMFHKGGYIVPRFHWGGGLGSDEVPIIGQTGEGVLSRRGMAALDRLNNGGGLGGVTVQVNVENRSSAPVNAKQTGASFDGKKYVVGVVLEDLNNYGPISQTMGRK